MNFAQVVQAVLDITKRPDKQVETERAVNAALSFLILKAEFPQDLVEATLPISTSEYTGSISIASLVRFRKFKFINPSGQRRYLTLISPEQVFTPGSAVQHNTYYVAGTTLNYILSILNSDGILNVGYYQYPPTLAGNETHWLLEYAPQCVIDRAAGYIFQQIGDESSMGTHMNMSMELYNTLVRDLSQP
jgi:hypothetical protein